MERKNKYALQYISQGDTPQKHLQHIGKVCEAGCRWVQLRLKNVSALEYLETAQKARTICDQYGAVLIINDNIGVAGESGADGVHLGLSDTNPKAARVQLGDKAIIGGTANTLEDCLQHIADGVDYIGLGPYRFTETKKNLSPILGIQGYQEISNELKNRKQTIPVVAIGGILTTDVTRLFETGISGIAVSGLLTQEKENNLEELIEMINRQAIVLSN